MLDSEQPKILNGRKLDCNYCQNHNCFLKTHLNTEQVSRINDHKFQAEYKKNEVLFKKGEYSDGIYLIQKGWIKIISPGRAYKDQIVRIAKEGDIIGQPEKFSKQNSISASSFTYSRICFVESNLLYELLMEVPELTYSMMQFYARELSKSEIRMKYLGQMSVREKVAESLLVYKNTFGTIGSGNTIKIPVSRSDIADLSGTSADLVSKQLKQFEEEKLILRVKRNIQIKDEVELKELVSDFDVDEYFMQN